MTAAASHRSIPLLCLCEQRNNRSAQAFASDTAFVFGRGTKGDYVRLATIRGPLNPDSYADADAALDCSGSNDSESDSIDSSTLERMPLRILQLIQVKLHAGHLHIVC